MLPTEPTDFPVLLDVGAAPARWFYDSFGGENRTASPSNGEALLIPVGVQRKNRMCVQFGILIRTTKQELENDISRGSDDSCMWRFIYFLTTSTVLAFDTQKQLILHPQ